MIYLLLVTASTVVSTKPLDIWSSIDVEEKKPLVIQQGSSAPTLRESITDSLSMEMLKRERESTPSITFRELPPREPLERDIERYLLNPGQ